MKKILFVLPTITQTNGVAAFAKNYISHIHSEELEFSVLCNDLRPSEEYKAFFSSEGRKIYFLPYARTTKLTEYLKAIKEFFEQHSDFDLVYCNNGYQSCFVYYYARKVGIKNFALHAHATVRSDNKIKSMIGSMLQLVANKKIKNKFACSTEAGHAMFGSDKFICIPNAIEYEKYRFDGNAREELRKQYNIKETDKLIGFVGRYAEQKNVFFFIELAKYLDNNVKILMIGSGDLKKKFIDKVQEDGLNDRFITLDETNCVHRYYSAMDIFVLPSLYEGLPVTAIEAQANGLSCMLSSAISRETNISGNVKYLDICEIDDWVKCIKDSTVVRRSAVALDGTFNINEQSMKFEKLLMEISK